MKDFIKWLGVNEKVAKVVVWLSLVMVFLIIVNAALESVGFPYYAITYDNLIRINANKMVGIIVAITVSILNFYAIALLVFRVKETKKLFKYAILYLILNWVIKMLFGYGAMQVFIVIFDIVFCYLYSGKQAKYILYAIIARIVTTVVEGIWYSFKIKFINYSDLNYITKSILSLDGFIIIVIIILVKEIYLKKRGEKQCQKYQDVGYGGENSTKKTNLPKKSQKKQQKQLNNK